MRWLAPLVLLVSLAGPSGPPSSSCDRASTAQEKALCADPGLSQLDGQLARAYDALRQQLSSVGARHVQEDQRAWLRWLRTVCPPSAPQLAACLSQEYQRRLEPLQAGVLQRGGVRFLPRLTVLTVPDKGMDELAINDPGFGVGRFQWLEIDKPTPAQARWNEALRAQMVQLRGRELTAQSVYGEQENLACTLEAVNEQLIAVTLRDDFYGYGAAHPDEEQASFLWLVQSQRALEARDVFREDSGWEQALTKQAHERLLASPVASELYHREDLGAVAKVVSHPIYWMPGPQALRIDFPEYSVAARPAGSPVVAVPWTALASYLAPGFDPARLPARNTQP